MVGQNWTSQDLMILHRRLGPNTAQQAVCYAVCNERAREAPPAIRSAYVRLIRSRDRCRPCSSVSSHLFLVITNLLAGRACNSASGRACRGTCGEDGPGHWVNLPSLEHVLCGPSASERRERLVGAFRWHWHMKLGPWAAHSTACMRCRGVCMRVRREFWWCRMTKNDGCHSPLTPPRLLTTHAAPLQLLLPSFPLQRCMPCFGA